jgi:hypothetical protein
VQISRRTVQLLSGYGIFEKKKRASPHRKEENHQAIRGCNEKGGRRIGINDDGTTDG